MCCDDAVVDPVERTGAGVGAAHRNVVCDDDVCAARVARATVVGLVVVTASTVRWANASARALVMEYGADWTGPRSGSLLAVLSEVPPGGSRAEVRWTAEGGTTRWWDVTCRRLDETDTGRGTTLYEITDVTARQERATRSRNGEWRLARLEALARMGTWEWSLVDDRVEWSDALLRLFGLPDGEGLNFTEYQSLLHPDDVPLIERTLADALSACTPFTYTHRMYLADRTTERVFECYGEVITDPAGQPVRVIGTARDVTEHHRAQQELAFLAGHDPLTQLANRRGITDQLAQCAADPTGGSLLLLDIDNFKDVNDRRGHAIGDHVLRAVAEMLAAALHPPALLGRLGGDEFAVVLPGVDVTSALGLGERLCDTVARTPVVHEDVVLRITTSVGVASIAPRSDPEVAFVHADLALYEAKGAGRNRARLFTRS